MRQLNVLRRLLQPICSCSSSSGPTTLATAAAAAAALPNQWRCASSSSSSGGGGGRAGARERTPKAAGDVPLTPEQQQHVSVLRYLVARPLEAAHNAALLTALAASYRDLFVVADQMHKKDILGIPRPLLDEPPAAAAAAGSSGAQDDQQQQQPRPVLNSTQMFMPVRDLTKLPDEVPPPGGWLRNHLQEKHMTRITAFAQLLPNHLEVNYHVGSFIYLWPPQESYFPGYLDMDSALRHLRPHFKKARFARRSARNSKVRCSLGWKRRTPYHKQRVFGTPHVPPSLLQQ